MGSPYDRERQVAIDAVRTAARICRTVQSSLAPDALEKKDRSPVTIADFSSQAVICRELGTNFPDDPIIAEEDSAELRTAENRPFLERIRKEIAGVDIEATSDDVCDWIDRGNASSFSPRFWTLDPIDGTKGFLRGDQYAVSLALIVDGRVTVSALACPNLAPNADESGTGLIFHAVRGAGARVQRLEDRDGKAVAVSATDTPRDLRFCESVESSHSAHGRSAAVLERLGIEAPPVRIDSQAKYAIVARGEAEVYLRIPTRPDYREKIWDHAGGVLIVEEAGGRVTDVDGRDLDFTHGSEFHENRGVIVSNGRCHDQLVAALQAVGV